MNDKKETNNSHALASNILRSETAIWACFEHVEGLVTRQHVEWVLERAASFLESTPVDEPRCECCGASKTVRDILAEDA